jgi:hypothetical protein
MIFTLFGVGANIFILRKYRINYIYIFEIDPKSRLGHMEILRVSKNIIFNLMHFAPKIFIINFF